MTHAQLPVVITALPGRVSGIRATLYMTHAQLPVVITALPGRVSLYDGVEQVKH